MPKVTYIHPDGSKTVLDVAVGTSVMQAAVANGIDAIVAECGGNLMCATCHVYVDAEYGDRVGDMSPEEDEMLACTACIREGNSRLSCQLVITKELDGLVVTLPEGQL